MVSSIASDNLLMSEGESDSEARQQTIKSATSCSFCSKPYKVPKILPRCAHTFCFHCITELADGTAEVKCPECQLTNIIGTKGGKYLKTNVQLEKIVAIIMKTEDARKLSENATQAKSSTDSCTHSKLPKSLCKHCGAEFCQICEIGHKEMLKFEVIQLAEQFQKRRNVCSGAIEKALANVQVSCQRAEVKKEIDEAFGRLVRSLAMVVSEEKTKLSKSMDTMIKARMAEVDEITENFRKIAMHFEIAQKLPYTSVLDMSLSELCSLHGQMASIENQISDCEALKPNVSNTRLHFAQSISDELVQQLVTNGVLRWKGEPEGKQPSGALEKSNDNEKEDPNLGTILAKVHDAVTKNNLRFFRDIAKTRTLSPASLCKMTRHVDKKDGLTPVQLAVTKGRLDILKILVEDFHADLSEKSEGTILHMAVHRGNLGMVKYLVEKEPSLCETFDSKYGQTPLHAAAINGQVEMVRYFLCQPKLSTETVNRSGQTVLHLAAMFDHPSLIKVLLENGANVCAVESSGNQAIHLAAMKGFIGIVNILLRQKPDLVYIVNGKGETPFKIATLNRFKAVEVLLTNVKNSLENGDQFYLSY